MTWTPQDNEFICLSLQSLEEKDRKHAHQKDSLNREQRYLLRRLDQLGTSVPMNKRRSVSECSISTVSSTNSTTGSPSSLCELGELWLVVDQGQRMRGDWSLTRDYSIGGGAPLSLFALSTSQTRLLCTQLSSVLTHSWPWC